MPKSKYRDADAVRFGAIVTRLRNERGWTIRKLAQRLGMNPVYIGVLEKGGNVTSLRTLLELADVFNVPASELMRELEEARKNAMKARRAAKE